MKSAQTRLPQAIDAQLDLIAEWLPEAVLHRVLGACLTQLVLRYLDEVLLRRRHLDSTAGAGAGVGGAKIAELMSSDCGELAAPRCVCANTRRRGGARRGVGGGGAGATRAWQLSSRESATFARGKNTQGVDRPRTHHAQTETAATLRTSMGGFGYPAGTKHIEFELQAAVSF